jgi:uncharacterized protein YgfB (UPF0149 family)
VADPEKKLEIIEVTDLAARVTPYLFIDELHGSVIGVIVGRGISRETDFLLEEFKALQGEDAEINDLELENFVKKTIEELQDPDLSFVPYLNSADDLNKLAESLAQWCSSFLAGFALGCGEERRELPPDIQEIIKDFAALTAMEAEDTPGSVEEDSYMQIFEYVRVTVLWMYDLMIEQP